MRNWKDMIGAGFANGKLLCLGLDPDWKKIPKHLKSDTIAQTDVVVDFCKKIVDATAHLVLTYKPNIAFFARRGARGIEGLRRLVAYINAVAPHAVVILDSKRGDIGNSMAGYVEEAFVEIGAHAMTANPYLGQDACQPLLNEKDHGAVFLCKTSNPGSGEFQNARMLIDDPEEEKFLAEFGTVSYLLGQHPAVELYQHVAYRVSRHWNDNGNCALVVGATYPAELQSIRRIVGNMPIVIPGIGTQGGDEEATIAAGRDDRNRGMIINVGSAILYASSDEDYVEAAVAKAEYYSARFLNLANA